MVKPMATDPRTDSVQPVLMTCGELDREVGFIDERYEMTF